MNWVRNEANGGMRRIVVIREGEAVDFVPQSGVSYADDVSTVFDPDNFFVAGSNQIIYEGGAGDDDFVTITGLEEDTEYHIAIFEYNISLDGNNDPVAGTEGYLSSPARGQQFTLDDAVILSAQSGPWSSPETWVGGNVPPAGSDVVIFDGHEVNVDVNTDALNSLTINSAATLTFPSEPSFSLVMQGGSSLIMQSGGAFERGGGLVSFLGSDSPNQPHLISGAFAFNDVRIQGGAESTGLNFGTSSQLFGTLEIAAGGFVQTNAPAYQSGSTLFYNTGGTFNRGAEWPPFDEGSGNSPFNVRINAELDMFGHTTPREARGNLQIDEDASLTLSTEVGGDLLVGGNWTNEGTFNANFRAVIFNGNVRQEVNNTAGIRIDFLRNENTSADGLVFNNNVSVLDFRNEGKLSFNSGNGGPFTFTLIRDTRDVLPVLARFTNNYDEGTIDLSNAVLTFDAQDDSDPVLFFTAAEDSRLIFGGVDFPLGNPLVKDGPGELVLQGEANTSLFIDAGLLRLEDGFVFNTPASRNIDLGTAIEAGGRHTARAELVLANGAYAMNSVRVRSLNASSGDRILRFVSADEAAPATLDAALDLEKLLFVRVEADHYGALNGPVTGSSPFVKQETGSLSLATATFGPGLFIDEGRVILEAFPLTGTQTIALGTSADLPIVASDATLEILDLDTEDFIIARPVEIRGGRTNNPDPGVREIIFATSAGITATLSSGIALPTTLDVRVIEGSSGAISGIVTGSSGLNKRGAGQLDLSGNNTFTGTVQLFGGTLRLGGDGLPGTNPIQVRGDVGIASTGSGSTGARTIANNVEFFDAGLRLGQETGGTGTLTFTGGFELGGAERFINTPGGTHNISGNIVNGQLRKEGAGQLNLSGLNTVSKTTIDEGVLGLARSETSGFILGNEIILNGGELKYETIQNNQLNNNTDLVINDGLFAIGARTDQVQSLVINGGQISKAGANAFTISGNAQLLGGGLLFTTVAGNMLFQDDLVLGNVLANYTAEGVASTSNEIFRFEGEVVTILENTNPQFVDNGTSTPRFSLRNSNRVMNTQAGSLIEIGWRVSDGTITKEGPGTLRLTGDNTFAGGISINAGTVAVTNNAALGASAGTVTLNGGTLRADADVSVANPIALAGSGIRTIAVSDDGAAESSMNFTLTHTGEMSGTGDLTKTGPGTLTLGGNASFNGATVVQAGILNVNAGFASTDLSIEDGSELNFGGSGDPRVLTLSGLSIGSDATLTLGGDNDVFTIPDTFPVTIPATATVNTSGTGARLTLQSGAVYRNLSSSTPTLRVERAFAGDENNSDRQGWRMLASPVETSYQDMFETDANPSTFVTQGFTGSTYSNRQFNLLWWDETDSTGTTLQRWRIPEGASETIPAGRGHFFYIFDGAPYPDNNDTYTDNLPLTMSATGVEPNLTDNNLPFISGSRFQLPVTFTAVSDSVVVDDTFIGVLVQDQGWNLVGNPTASWLDWNADSGTPAPWTKTNMSNVIYVWDPSANGGNGDYLVTNGEAGNHDGIIAPFQAFWVQAVAQDPVLSFGNDAKTVAPNTNSGFVGRPVMSAAGPGASDFHGVSPNNTETSDGPDAGGGATVLPLRLRVAEGGAARTAEKFVMLSERGQFGADRWDAYRLQPMSDSWLTLASAMAPGSAPLVINSLPAAQAIGGPLNLPLYVGGATAGLPLAGQFTLEWELPADWDPDLSLVLMDHELQKAIPMRGTQRSYSFSHATDPGMLGLMVSPAPGDGSGFGGPAQIGTPSPAPARGAATGRTAQASVASSGTGSALASTSTSASVPLLPATLLGGTHLPADWSPDFTATAALLPEGLATAPARPDDAHIPYIPLAVAAEAFGSGTGSGTALGRSLPAGSGGAVPEARFSIFMQPLSGGPGADETIPYTPIGISLAQNYPNPFNPATTVRFSLPEEAEIRLEVFDLLGRRIALLAADRFPAGTHTLRWDATGQATGLYLLRLSAPETGTVQTRKMMLVR
ncbi:MAG: autotransporter-associated beta strand repeat-containing protein [Balneolales bacterium]|nr:autotransporter-associated beta strand repeat-containing protein [Balneolales bacterium]